MIEAIRKYIAEHQQELQALASIEGENTPLWMDILIGIGAETLCAGTPETPVDDTAWDEAQAQVEACLRVRTRYVVEIDGTEIGVIDTV